MNIAWGIFVVGSLALIIAGIRIMEIIKTSAHGDFVTNDQGTTFKLFAHVINDGISNIEVKDIKIQIERKNMFCLLQGDIIKREDNDIVLISPRALNHEHIALMLTPIKKNLKIDGSYLSTNHVLREDTADAVLTVITELNVPQRIFSRITFGIFAKKKCKFKFQRVEKNFRINPGEVIIPMKKC